MGFDEAVELAERHLNDLPFQQLVIEDQATGTDLEAQFKAAGWQTDREVTMALARGVDRDVDTSAVIEATREDALALMSRWWREAPARDDPSDTETQLLELWQREWRARNARLLGVRDESGELTAITVFYSDGAVAQVEDVYTVPEQRGRGYARMLISRALQLSAEGRHELTFIVADDRGWPQLLYGRLGFEPVGRIWAFHR